MNQRPNFTDSYPPHEQVKEWLPGYVMGALDPEEMYAVDQYLRREDELRQQLAELDLASQALAYVAPERTLSPAVKDRLMQRVRGDSTTRRNPFSAASSEASAKNRARQPADYSPLMRPPRIRLQRSWGSIWLPRLAGLAASAAIALLVWNNLQLRNGIATLGQQVVASQTQIASTQQQVAQLETTASTLTSANAQLQTDNRNLQTQADALQATNTTLQQSTDTLQQQVAAQRDQIDRFANALRSYTLAGTLSAPEANAIFYANDGSGTLVIRGLQPLSDQQTYQLWWITPAGVPAPGDLFNLIDAQAELINLAIPEPYADFAGIGISIEPAGGSQTPTEVVLLSS